MEWVILAIVALLLFGGARLAGIGKGAGRAIREFKDEMKGDDTPKPGLASSGADGHPEAANRAPEVADAEIVRETREKPTGA